MGFQTSKLVEKDIESLYEAPPTTTANLLLWCEKLRTMKLDWFRMKNECRNIVNKAHETGDDHEVLASYILFDIVPQLTKYVDDDEKGEDTFIKNYLECFLANVFSIEESMYQSWANVVLNNKNDDQVKPDWIAYVKPWFKKFNIVACEVKPPSKVGRGDISDYVKLGIEMKDMLNEIMDARVASASVLGILVEGKREINNIWTPHCGLICFSPLLSFSDTRFSVCGRVITTLVSHTQDAFEPIYITMIYAPATRRDRFVFLDSLAQNRTPLLPDVSSRHLVLGDFNYTYATHISSAVPRQAPPSWLSYIDHLFQDCISDKDCAC
ncbi:hypothetical protein G6F43_012535 [Rhizopus delemar]|nr:hypothetical protein G6F43_012535 [Rhizopus delemar]